MGTWGSGRFENDDAADWAWRLTPEADEGVVRSTLASDPGRRLPSEAAVVAAGIGRPHPELPDEVVAWVEARRDRPWDRLAAVARSAVDRVRGGSELDDLWAESDDTAWAHEVDDLRRRLESG